MAATTSETASKNWRCALRSIEYSILAVMSYERLPACKLNLNQFDTTAWKGSQVYGSEGRPFLRLESGWNRRISLRAKMVDKSERNSNRALPWSCAEEVCVSVIGFEQANPPGLFHGHVDARSSLPCEG